MFTRRTRFEPVRPHQAVALDAVTQFRAERFPGAGPLPWLDRPDAEQEIVRRAEAGRLSALEAGLARKWHRDGFVVLEGFYAAGRLDRVWAAYERALAEGRVAPDAPPTDSDPLPGRALNPHFHVPQIDGLLRDPALVELISVLLGVEALPFQTIAGHKGSEQRAHSDAIHMTTYPLGYLAASWTAFEDIRPDSGPLVYYPGSHRLPYVFADHVGISSEAFRERGYAEYHERYEPRIAQLLDQHGLEPFHFAARKGDVLLWHGNLIHGGSPRERPGSSRRALVCHYFAKGCLTYHDLASSRSHLHDGRSAALR